MGETSFIIVLIIFNIMFVAFIVAIVVFVRQYKKKKKEHDKQMQNIEETHKKELLETQVEIQKQTMTHIGREIHDNVGQKMTLASLYIQQLEYQNIEEEVIDKTKVISKIINESLHDLRQLSKTLTDDSIANNSLYDLLQKECIKVKDLKQCKVTFVGDATISMESYEKKSILFRVTQEFLQNSIKHSDCETIFVSLQKTEKYIILLLKDDGKGFDSTIAKSGIGLKNMKKRTEIIGGSFTMLSREFFGTELIIKISIK